MPEIQDIQEKEKEKESNTLTRINKLPHEMANEIYSFIPSGIKLFLSQTLYKKYHILLKKYIIKPDQYENYLRHIIRNDYNVVFQRVINENGIHWLKYKKQIYKNTVFTNYIYLLEKLCIDFESTNCRNVLNDFLYKSGFSKNQHKKNMVKLINKGWSN